MEFPLACGRGDLELMFEIIKKDPLVVHTAGLAGWTPIFYAVRSNEISAVDALLKRGANPHICDITGTSSYHIAVKKGYQTIVDLIENNGVSPS